MKKYWKYIIIALIVIVIIALITVALTKNTKPNNKDIEVKNLEENTENIAKEVTSEDLTYEEFTEIIGQDVPNVHIAVGTNSYLRNKPEEKAIKKYKLSKYITLQESLVNKVEKKYLENLSYEIISTYNIDNKECHNVKIISYYYAMYLNDLLNLTNELAPSDIEDAATNEKDAVEYYKAQVKALKILDNHLDDYDNKTKEESFHEVCYINGKIESSDAALGFTGALQGERYPNVDYSDPNTEVKTQERLNQYLKEAATINLFN